MPYAPDKPPGELIPDQVTCRSARFETRWPQPSTAVVSAKGELDAANGNEFVNYALRDPATTQWLIIDLSGLSFFGSAGFSALHTLNVQCAGNDIRWALVPSLAVDRLLRICDPDSTLPICVDVSTAMTTVHNDPPRLLELVPQTS
ncbi:anti-anti-sigma regulatory factor (antagonist of anti-sigma factor) [Mycolicibacterium chubuense NBB4]|uniref:Anti-anti-sigma regulatory factor (Antagonist of anti-sigma factor) n=1 Tax=Mycolicibacterium chubuense (strain NBB4) TaxID=710421 RepID=I4BFL1_MYCCN|nr:STAS domain-containing protein [Mycolicibacterium chubuense]AFM16068.1 anti-anti-sigma regulatory factor (antagonist of anti-sigma factor) [Mycolicibacterium chubuense NBB4]